MRPRLRTSTSSSAPPLTGPAAPGYSEIPTGVQAYFDYVNDNGGIVATPDIHAQQQMMYPRIGGYGGMYYWPNNAHAPQTDTSVHTSNNR